MLVMHGLTIIDLGTDDLATAWPLARTASPWLSLDGWKCSVEEIIGHGGGVIAVVAPDGCLHGVATYQPIDKRRAGRVLFIETLVTFELSRKALVRRFLCESLERMSLALGCDGIAVSMPADTVQDSWRSGDWLAGTPKEASRGLLFS